MQLRRSLAACQKVSRRLIPTCTSCGAPCCPPLVLEAARLESSLVGLVHIGIAWGLGIKAEETYAERGLPAAYKSVEAQRLQLRVNIRQRVRPAGRSRVLL
jgi:hypothetical protein